MSCQTSSQMRIKSSVQRTPLGLISTSRDNLYKKFCRNGFKSEDKSVFERHRQICFDTIPATKENYIKRQGEKLADLNTAPKTYWKIHF